VTTDHDGRTAAPGTPAAPPTPNASRPGSVLRLVATLLLLIVLLGAAFYLGVVASAASGFFGGLRTTETTSVRPQPAVVIAVREMSRLETTNFHIERVIDLTEEQSRLWGYLNSKDKILLVAAADVRAGVDLGNLRPEDVRADAAGKSISVTLPAPEILSTTLDNERTYVHSRSTDLLATRKEDLETRARQEAEATLRKAALDAGILDRARDGAQKAVEALLRSCGYETIAISWR
jgi:Arc/MetJ family transcription regulator